MPYSHRTHQLTHRLQLPLISPAPVDPHAGFVAPRGFCFSVSLSLHVLIFFSPSFPCLRSFIFGHYCFSVVVVAAAAVVVLFFIPFLHLRRNSFHGGLCRFKLRACVYGARSREEACRRASRHSVQLTRDLYAHTLIFFFLYSSLFKIFFPTPPLSSISLSLKDGGTRGRRSAMEADLKMKK